MHNFKNNVIYDKNNSTYLDIVNEFYTEKHVDDLTKQMSTNDQTQSTNGQTQLTNDQTQSTNGQTQLTNDQKIAIIRDIIKTIQSSIKPHDDLLRSDVNRKNLIDDFNILIGTLSNTGGKRRRKSSRKPSRKQNRRRTRRRTRRTRRTRRH